MAKIITAPTISYISGKIGEGVYMVSQKPGISYIRAYVYPTIPEHNHDLAAVTKNLSRIWINNVSESYKYELTIYARAYRNMANPRKPYSEHAFNNFSYFIQLMYTAFYKGDITIALNKVTWNHITQHYGNFTDICRACINSYMIKVPGYEQLTAIM